jgi:hypothetical protein
MGGQACILYGAAEFSRDLDLLVLADAANLPNMVRALGALDAETIAVPPLEERHLSRGHAVHLRCRRDDVAGLRIDLMSCLRGVAGFNELWARRTTVQVAGEPIDLLAMEDLVRAKKTQRDKDWPMIRRLVEQSYFGHSANATQELVRFWLRELRTPELLVEVAGAHPELAGAEAVLRPAVQAALSARPDDVSEALEGEEREERRKDREYWAPLKQELEELRRGARALRGRAILEPRTFPGGSS